jgi:TP901 family phage tail tape measure protein
MPFTAQYTYIIKDRYSAALSKITRGTNKFTAATKKAVRHTAALGKKIGITGRKMANMRNIVGGAALAYGLFKFTKNASTLEDKMADVSRVTGLVGGELRAMQEQLQKMGRATGKSAEGLAEIAYEGGKLGIVNEDLGSFVLMVAKTAAAFDMLDGEAGRAIGSIRAKMGLTVGGAEELMNRLNFLADNTTATGGRMIEVVERTSGTFSTLNIPSETVAGWAAFADQIEVTGRLAASGLNQMMTKMMVMPGMMEKMLEDPKGAVKDYLKSFENMPEAKRGTRILKIFGNEAGRFVMKAVANMKLLDKAMEMAASDRALGSMDREFQNILNRSSTAGNRIKETWLDITRAIGTGFLRMFDKYSARLIKISDWLLGFVKAHPTLVKVAGILALIAVAVIAIIIPLGFMMIAISALIPVVAALGVATSFMIGLGTLMWIAWSPLILMFGAVALAAAAVAAAIYQITTNWEAMTSTGAGKDLFDYLTNRDPERLAQPNRTEAENAALEKSQERIAAKKQAGIAASGEIRVSASEGSKIDSANMSLNAGNNLATVSQ